MFGGIYVGDHIVETQGFKSFSHYKFVYYLSSGRGPFGPREGGGGLIDTIYVVDH